MKDEDKNTPDLHPYGHEMSDKDPVREQIERDAVSFNPDSIYRITAVRDEQLKFFKKGATHQDPIAWNRCLDEVIREIDNETDYLTMSWKTKSASK